MAHSGEVGRFSGSRFGGSRFRGSGFTAWWADDPAPSRRAAAQRAERAVEASESNRPAERRVERGQKHRRESRSSGRLHASAPTDGRGVGASNVSRHVVTSTTGDRSLRFGARLSVRWLGSHPCDGHPDPRVSGAGGSVVPRCRAVFFPADGRSVGSGKIPPRRRDTIPSLEKEPAERDPAKSAPDRCGRAEGEPRGHALGLHSRLGRGFGVSGCLEQVRGYPEPVNWQEPAALVVVVLTAGILGWRWWRRRRAALSPGGACRCGCAASLSSPPRETLVYRARKGQRPQLIVRPGRSDGPGPR